MCTLIVLHRCLPGRPLVVAANRDEFLDRPADGPALRSSKAGPIVAPLDLEAGGTWVGVSARGVFAGLTNLRPAAREARAVGDLGSESTAESFIESGKRFQSELRSRGEVVMMALEAKSAADAIRALSKLEKDTYNPFQLLVADGHDAWLIVYRGSSRAVALEPGAHIVGNVVDEGIEAEIRKFEKSGEPAKFSEESESSPVAVAEEEPRARKLTRIRTRVEKLMTEPDQDYFEGLARICREHVVAERDGEWNDERDVSSEDHSPFESTCVHVANRYGTRSSLLLEISTDPAANRLWTTDGPPCAEPFENRSFLLKELGLRLSHRAGTETT
jgi:uncharacterized protein with NRDE domain